MTPASLAMLFHSAFSTEVKSKIVSTLTENSKRCLF